MEIINSPEIVLNKEEQETVDKMIQLLHEIVRHDIDGTFFELSEAESIISNIFYDEVFTKQW